MGPYRKHPRQRPAGPPSPLVCPCPRAAALLPCSVLLLKDPPRPPAKQKAREFFQSSVSQFLYVVRFSDDRSFGRPKIDQSKIVVVESRSVVIRSQGGPLAVHGRSIPM